MKKIITLMILLNLAYGIVTLPALVLALGFGVLGRACDVTKATGSMKNGYSKCLNQSLWLECA